MSALPHPRRPRFAPVRLDHVPGSGRTSAFDRFLDGLGNFAAESLQSFNVFVAEGARA